MTEPKKPAKRARKPTEQQRRKKAFNELASQRVKPTPNR